MRAGVNKLRPIIKQNRNAPLEVMRNEWQQGRKVLPSISGLGKEGLVVKLKNPDRDHSQCKFRKGS